MSRPGFFRVIGLAAYLLPFLILAAAWRRIRSRRINAPVSAARGLNLLVLSSAALLSLANIKPFFDASFNAGGLVGAVIARALVGGLKYNRRNDSVRSQSRPRGLLLATNFSFANFYRNVRCDYGRSFRSVALNT